MMNGIEGMGWGMGMELVSLLILVLLALGIVAPTKYILLGLE